MTTDRIEQQATQIEKQRARIWQLEREVAELRRDADCYRHLCDTHPGCLCFQGNDYQTKEEFSAAILADLAAKEAGK